MNETARTAERLAAPTLILRRVTAVVAGALLVALGAQLSVPVPGTPVPVTFQVPAALIVGGLLGPGLGAASLAAYVVLGAAGVPVFAPFGVPGLARLFGPTGGYLLALPLGAAIAGALAHGGRRWWHVGAGLVGGLAVIHLGGIAQLAMLGGDLGVAWRAGSRPFLAGDIAKLILAGLVVARFRAPTRRALR
jgi:biotin transport system substrate-specific component